MKPIFEEVIGMLEHIQKLDAIATSTNRMFITALIKAGQAMIIENYSQGSVQHFRKVVQIVENRMSGGSMLDEDPETVRWIESLRGK